MGNEGSKKGKESDGSSHASTVPSTEHTGHIDCHCLHNKNETLEEARRAKRIHLNSACFWSCCGARWDDFTCTRNNTENHPTPGGEPTPGNGPHEHTGFIACKCGHKRKEVWAEAKTHDIVHKDGACVWSCCGENWSVAECSGGGLEIDLSQHVHKGHVVCRCAHHKDDTVQSLKASKRVHLNIRCFWSCCGARWDDPICECELPESLKGRPPNGDDEIPSLLRGKRHHHHHQHPEDRDQPKPKPKKKSPSDFNKSILYDDDDIGKSDYDIGY